MPTPPEGYSYADLIHDLQHAARLLKRIGACYDGRTAGWTPDSLTYEAHYLFKHVDRGTEVVQ